MPALTLTAAIVAVVVFGALVIFQAALAAGVPWGRAAYGGQTEGVLPTHFRVSSAVAVVIWTGVALIVARAGGIPVWAPLPDAWLPVAIWVIVALNLLGLVMNTITRSRLERAIWLPASLVLFATTLIVALTAPV